MSDSGLVGVILENRNFFLARELKTIRIAGRRDASYTALICNAKKRCFITRKPTQVPPIGEELPIPRAAEASRRGHGQTMQFLGSILNAGAFLLFRYFDGVGEKPSSLSIKHRTLLVWHICSSLW